MDPDLSQLAGCHPVVTGIHQFNRCPASREPTSHKGADITITVTLPGWTDLAEFESRGAYVLDPRTCSSRGAGHEECGLGQTITRIKARFAEAARGEFLCERLERCGLDRLRPRPGQAPTAQVQLGHNMIGYAIH